MDDDGENEIVIITRDLDSGVLQVFDGQTHALECMSVEYRNSVFISMEVGDVDGDGETEIVIGDGCPHTGKNEVFVIVFDGSTCTEEWRSANLGGYPDYINDIELGDVDCDGNIEIIASVYGESVNVIDGVTKRIDWKRNISVRALETADINHDGRVEMLVNDGGSINVYNYLFEEIDSIYACSGIIGMHVADVDGNGVDDVVVSCGSSLRVINPYSGAVLWRMFGLGDMLAFRNQIFCGDIDQDSHQEIVVGGCYRLYQFEVGIGDTCDGIDNDGDGQTDEGLERRPCDTACGPGYESCTLGVWQGCTAPQPVQEMCDGVDNDCNDIVDDGLTRNCYSDCGQGIETCVDGEWIGCTARLPSEEICDDIDNDCDGDTDEDFGTTTCGAGQCVHSVDNCLNGELQICDPYEGESGEICDLLDNDCDGDTDELGKVTCGKGPCEVTVEACVDGEVQACVPLKPEEYMERTCTDGIDNDCDGNIDYDDINCKGRTDGGDIIDGQVTGGGCGCNSAKPETLGLIASIFVLILLRRRRTSIP